MKRCCAAMLLGLFLTTTTSADDWPQWQGPNRDGISKETGLLQEWPEGGPALRWQQLEIGTGYSTPVVAAGRVYVQTTHGDEEFAVAFDEATGEELWSVPIGKVGKNIGPQYPGTRSSPTVDGDVMYCVASAGGLVCLATADGETKWKRHFVEDFGGKVGFWAYSESVLIDGNLLVCTPGGPRATLAALDKTNGEVVWESAIPDGDVADYASVKIVKQPIKQYTQFLRKGLVGVNAETGDFLWRYDATSDQGANIITPVVKDNYVFTSGRPGGGLVELKADGDGVAATEVYLQKPLAPSIGGAVLLDGALYGTNRQVMFCADFLTGEMIWTDRALGAASICYADGCLYVRGHTDGDVALVKATKEGYQELGRFMPEHRSEIRAWPHPIVANGCLYLRDQDFLLCYEVAAPK